MPTHSLEPAHANPLTTRPFGFQVCNHPFLFDEYKLGTGNEFLIRACGKLAILDRILPKLQVCAFGQAACMCLLPLLATAAMCVCSSPACKVCERVKCASVFSCASERASVVASRFCLCARMYGHMQMDTCRFSCASD